MPSFFAVTDADIIPTSAMQLFLPSFCLARVQPRRAFARGRQQS